MAISYSKASFASFRAYGIPIPIHYLIYVSSYYYSNPNFFSRQYYSTNRQLFLDSVKQKCQLGFCDFNQLVSLQPLPSIVVFSQLFTAMTKIKPNPPFSHVLVFSNKLDFESALSPARFSISIVATCYCRLGRASLAFPLLGQSTLNPGSLVFHPDKAVIDVGSAHYPDSLSSPLAKLLFASDEELSSVRGSWNRVIYSYSDPTEKILKKIGNFLVQAGLTKEDQIR